MARDLSDAAKASAFSAETEEAWLALVTLEHASLAEPIRVVNNGADVTSNGETFMAYPFQLTLPDDSENGPPRAKIVIDNIDRQITMAVRSLASAMTVTIQIILASDPDTVEVEYLDFRLTDITYDAMSVEATLSVEDFTSEPYPAATFSPSLFPALF